MKVVVTLEVDYVVDLPTHNGPLAVRAVIENWENFKHHAKVREFQPNLSGRFVRARAEEETGGKR